MPEVVYNMQCVILAAGEGKRMRPLTASRPKVMLPVANRPMLEHLVVSVRETGISDFVFVVGYREQEIRDYFGDGGWLDVRIRYSVQRKQRGTADALNTARDFLTGDFLMLNGDMIVLPDDIKRFCGMKPPCIAVFESERPEEFGVVTVEGEMVSGLVEKSPNPPGNLINAGAYLLAPDIFEKIDLIELSERGEFELTDALQPFIQSGLLSVCRLSSWCDIGEPWNLLDANESFLSSVSEVNEGEIEDYVVIKGPVVIGKGSIIRSGSYIEGPCIIGDNCMIGPHAYIRPSTSIGDGCHIGHSSEIKNSVIMHETKIPHFNYVGDSVIGSGCNFGAGSKIANLRHDRRNVKSAGRDTGRKKFGAVVGDNVQLGINCSVNVGTIIGSGVMAAPGSFLEGNIAEKTRIGR